MREARYVGGPADGHLHQVDDDPLPPLNMSAYVDCWSPACFAGLPPAEQQRRRADGRHHALYQRPTTVPADGPLEYHFDPSSSDPEPSPECRAEARYMNDWRLKRNAGTH